MKTLASKAFFVIAIGILLLTGAQLSYAATPPELMLSDGIGNAVTIDSTGAVTCVGSCTTELDLVKSGNVTWGGTVGIFTVNIVGGSSSKPSPQINLGFLVQTGTTGGGTLTVKWTDTGFGGTGPSTMMFATTPSGDTSTTFTSYVDSTNTPFGMGTLVDTLGAYISATSQTMTGLPGPTTEPFSMTNVVTLTLGANSSLSLAGFALTETPPPPLALACAASSGQLGVAYSSGLMASGGVAPFSFSIIAGSLPPGLMLNPSTGAITGTPTTAGTFSFTAQVMDSSGNSARGTVTASCSITITTPPAQLALMCAAATGEAGVAYSSSLTATGGVPPYAFSITGGSLPNGLNLNPTTGAIAGTPTAAGTFSFTAQVQDSSGNSATNTVTKSCTITIAPALALTCAANTAQVGVAYNSSLVATGGVSPYTYSISAGSLPPGLSLNPSTGAITGTPTTTGTYNFAAQVVDSSGNSVTDTVTSNCIITVIPPPVTLACPGGTAQVGVPYSSCLLYTSDAADE